MLTNILSSGTSSLSLIILSLMAIVLGFVVALVHKKTSKYNKNFLTTLTLLPLLVMAVILIVNDSLGMSVAVAGTFGLIRFRSVPGTSKEILSVFFAMAIGLALGAGYILLAPAITVLASIVLLVLNGVKIFEKNSSEKYLKIVMPENLDYTNVFDDVMKKYTESYSLVQVKTTNLGSMFELKYNVVIKNGVNEKKFIDDLRTKNGNLKIGLSSEVVEMEL